MTDKIQNFYSDRPPSGNPAPYLSPKVEMLETLLN